MRTLLSAAFFWIASAIVPASATIVDVVFTGHVGFGLDMTGIFGSSNTQLFGKSYSARYRFDTSLGNVVTTSTVTSATGGPRSIYGGTSPALSASLTINGVTVEIGGSALGMIYAFSAPFQSNQSYEAAQYSDAADFRTDHSIVHRIGAAGGILSNSFDVAQYYGPTSGFVGQTSQFQIAIFNKRTMTHTEFAFGSLVPETVSITPVASAVPEPATWAMMLAGFAGLGLAARRRRAGAA